MSRMMAMPPFGGARRAFAGKGSQAGSLGGAAAGGPPSNYGMSNQYGKPQPLLSGRGDRPGAGMSPQPIGGGGSVNPSVSQMMGGPS